MMRELDLISPSYRDMQRELHARPDGYGGKGKKWAQTVEVLVRRYQAWSVLDYGCGEGSLATRLKITPTLSGVRVAEYDPAIKGKDHPPGFADLVVCTDVLEHVEPDRLDAVLAHIRGLARKVAFLVAALDEANKTLSDGRNAHLILESPEWWMDRVVAAGFTLESLDGVPLPFKRQEKRSKRWIAVVLP